MALHLNDHWTEHVCGLPETGMGYHIVDVTLRDGKRIRNVLVFNSEEMQWPSDQGRIQPDDIINITAAHR